MKPTEIKKIYDIIRQVEQVNTSNNNFIVGGALTFNDMITDNIIIDGE